jgi:NAD(P)-dependent dehydrogenase (short-subunit alcohol dehydrogenase family)
MKAALVTGGSKGIGLAVAAAMLKEGWRVAICARNPDELRAAEAELGSAHLVTIRADLAGVPDCSDVVTTAIGAFGRLDVVVNNAGVYLPSALLDMSADEWDHTFAVNVRAPFLVARAAVRGMIAAGGGSIVNIASTNGLMSEPQFAHYNASKAALISLTESMAVEWAPYGVRVNAVAPGWIHTPLSEPWIKDLSREHLDSLFPMGRVGSAAEVADLVTYLCSGRCGYLTGATIRIDGGMLAKHPGL